MLLEKTFAQDIFKFISPQPSINLTIFSLK